VRSDQRTTGEWICVAERIETEGVPRDEMEVRVEVKANTASRDGLQQALEKRLKEDLGLAVRVKLVDQGSLAQLANTGGGEGKPRRLLDLRPAYKQ
jgi:phenylacetate-CoA ligase